MEIATSVLSMGYCAWLLKFTRGEEADFNTIIDCVKTKWVPLLVATILICPLSSLP